MSLTTAELHAAFVRALKYAVVSSSAIGKKPLDVDLSFPLPSQVRVYMYSLVVGGRNRRNEYKAVLRVPGQRVNVYGSFDHVPGRFSLLVGYASALDVFVLWDASQHFRFKNGGNIQVKASTVIEAAVTGFAGQWRRLTHQRTELVLACRSATLGNAVNERLIKTGATSDGRPV